MADDKLPKCGCGGEAKLMASRSSWRAECSQCGLRTRMADTAMDAFDLWTRAMSPALEALPEIEDFVEAISRRAFSDSWAKVDANIGDDDWMGGAALNFRDTLLKETRAVLEAALAPAAGTQGDHTEWCASHQGYAESSGHPTKWYPCNCRTQREPGGRL